MLIPFLLTSQAPATFLPRRHLSALGVCVCDGGTGVGEFVFHTTKSLAGAGVSEPTKELVVYYGWAAGVLHTTSV